MKTFELFVHDDRYSVPTLHLVSVAAEAMARGAAEALLRSSPHHLGVELWCEGEQIDALGVCAERRRGESRDELKLASGG